MGTADYGLETLLVVHAMAGNSKRVQTNNVLKYFASKPEGAELHTDPASNRAQDAQPLSHLSDEIDSDVAYTECEDEEEVQVVQQHQADQVYSYFAEDQDDTLEAALLVDYVTLL